MWHIFLYNKPPFFFQFFFLKTFSANKQCHLGLILTSSHCMNYDVKVGKDNWGKTTA